MAKLFKEITTGICQVLNWNLSSPKKSLCQVLSYLKKSLCHELFKEITLSSHELFKEIPTKICHQAVSAPRTSGSLLGMSRSSMTWRSSWEKKAVVSEKANVDTVYYASLDPHWKWTPTINKNVFPQLVRASFPWKQQENRWHKCCL